MSSFNRNSRLRRFYKIKTLVDIEMELIKKDFSLDYLFLKKGSEFRAEIAEEDNEIFKKLVLVDDSIALNINKKCLEKVIEE